LDSLTSQSLAGLAPGQSAETLLLDPQGRVEHAMHVLDDGERTWLLVDEGEAAGLAAWLDRMRFLLRVEVADRTADYLTIGWLDRGRGERPHAVANGVPLVWVDPWQELQAGGWQYATAAGHPAADWPW